MKKNGYGLLLATIIISVALFVSCYSAQKNDDTSSDDISSDTYTLGVSAFNTVIYETEPVTESHGTEFYTESDVRAESGETENGNAESDESDVSESISEQDSEQSWEDISESCAESGGDESNIESNSETERDDSKNDWELGEADPI